MQVGGAHFLAEKAPQAPGGAPQEHSIPGEPDPAVDAEVGVSVHYTVQGDGSLRMDWSIDASRALPARLRPPLFPCGTPFMFAMSHLSSCLLQVIHDRCGNK